MTDKKLGNKRVCKKCGAKFYDFEADEVRCPKCDYVFSADVTASASVSAKKKAAMSSVKRSKAAELDESIPNMDTGTDIAELETMEDDADVISIEEVEEHQEGLDVNPNGDDAEDEMFLNDKTSGELLDDVKEYLETDEEDDEDE